MTITSSPRLYKQASLLAAAALMLLQLYHAFHWPLWRDDGMFAEVAKSLAAGQSYSLALFDEHVLFSHGISAGPLVILPAALMMKLFGNTIWVPGLTAVLLNWACIALVFCAARRFPGKEQQWQFSFWFVLFALMLSITNDYNYGIETGDNLAMWYLLLGQVPALCCVVAGGLLLLDPAQLPKQLLAGALLLGIAFTTKSITAIASCVLLACLSLKLIRQHKKLLLLCLLMTALPAALFELVKCLSMGATDYLHMQAANANYYKGSGFASVTSRAAGESYFDTIIIHLYKILEFVFGLLFIVFLPVYVATLRHIFRRSSIPGNPLLVAGLAFLGCFVAHTAWWTFCAGAGSDRHLVPAFFYWAASTSLLLAAMPRETEADRKKLCIFFAAFFISHLDAAQFMFMQSLDANSRVQEYGTLVHQLEELQQQGVKLYTCGFNSEIEYLMNDTGNFINCKKLAKRDRSKKAVLVNFYVAENKVLIPMITYQKLTEVPSEVAKQCPATLSASKLVSLHWCE